MEHEILVLKRQVAELQAYVYGGQLSSPMDTPLTDTPPVAQVPAAASCQQARPKRQRSSSSSLPALSRKQFRTVLQQRIQSLSPPVLVNLRQQRACYHCFQQGHRMRDCLSNPAADEFGESADNLDGDREAQVPALTHALSSSTIADVPVISSSPTAYSDHFYAL